jgi:hypothetical protein
MGIKNFSKTFLANRVVKIKDLAGKTIAIDAMTEIYRAALGAKSVSTLTDRYGNSTLHISVILANVIEMQKQGITQIWVFDHDQSADVNIAFHNPLKIDELLKRKIRKDDAKEKLDQLDVLFSDSDEEIKESKESIDMAQKNKKSISDKKDSLEKQLFTASKNMINDIKLILNCLNIRYIEAPAGYEGEQIASYLSATDQCDGVYSSDTDPIPFGAKVHYRKNARDKKIYEYTAINLLKQIQEANEHFPKPKLNDLRKVCVAMGCDFAPKTPGVGAKTILKKLHLIKLTKKQIEAIKQFEKEPTEDIQVVNLDKQPFTNCNTQTLIDWLVKERSFTRSRVITWLNKVINVVLL